MQQPDGYSSTTIVSETSLNAVLEEIQAGVTYPNFFDGRYDDDQEPVEPQAQDVEVEE